MNQSPSETGMAPMDRLLLTESQTATILSVCPRTLFALRKSGQITASKIGTRVLYHIDEVKRFATDTVGKAMKV